MTHITSKELREISTNKPRPDLLDPEPACWRAADTIDDLMRVAELLVEAEKYADNEIIRTIRMVDEARALAKTLVEDK